MSSRYTLTFTMNDPIHGLCVHILIIIYYCLFYDTKCSGTCNGCNGHYAFATTVTILIIIIYLMTPFEPGLYIARRSQKSRRR